MPDSESIGPEEATPPGGSVKPKRKRHPGAWAEMTEDEHNLVQLVSKRERRNGWLKVFGVSGAVVALFQFFNANGPCATGWRFETRDAAAQVQKDNSLDHAAIRTETMTAIKAVNDKVDAVPQKVVDLLRAAQSTDDGKSKKGGRK